MNRSINVVAALLLTALVLLSCEKHHTRHEKQAPEQPAPAHNEPSPTTSEEADKLLRAKDKRIGELERETAREKSDRKVLQDEHDTLAADEQVKKIRRDAAYATWIAGFGFFACVVAFFLLASSGIPYIKMLSISGAGASIAVMALAQMLAWLAPYLLIVGCSMTGVGVLALVVYLWKGSKVTKSVVSLYEAAKPALDTAIGKASRLELQAEHTADHSKWIDSLRTKMGIK